MWGGEEEGGKSGGGEDDRKAQRRGKREGALWRLDRGYPAWWHKGASYYEKRKEIHEKMRKRSKGSQKTQIIIPSFAQLLTKEKRPWIINEGGG